MGEVCPLGLNLAPREELCPLGEMFTPSFTPRGEHFLLFRRMEGRTENLISPPQGIMSPQGTKFSPWGQLCPFGIKVSFRGEVKNGSLVLVANWPEEFEQQKFVAKTGLLKQVCMYTVSLNVSTKAWPLFLQNF
jgi:hypothetical protein